MSRVNPVDEKLRRRPDAKLGGDVSGVKMSQESDFARNGWAERGWVPKGRAPRGMSGTGRANSLIKIPSQQFYIPA